MPHPGWLARSVFYQIFPASFHDSDGDGIGDLPGIARKLDYLSDLGVNALLLHPFFESPFRNGGFDIADHRQVAPRYGTLGDFDALLAGAHGRDMRLCIDLVPGYTSDRHPWFQSSVRARCGARGEPADRYIWCGDPRRRRDPWLDFAPGASDCGDAYAYEGFVHQPAVNYGFARPQAAYHDTCDAPGPEASWAALRETMAFWLARGVDGFRILAPERMVRADPHYLQTRRRWRAVSDWLHERHPEAVLISSWGVPELAADAGFDLDLLLGAELAGYATLFLGPGSRPARATPGYFDAMTGRDFGGFWQEFDFQHRRLGEDCFTALPSSGPELQRLSHGRSVAELKLIHTFLMTWPSVPFIYYGDEIGMRYLAGIASREGAHEFAGSRTPMQWDDTALAGFSSHGASAPYLPLDPDPERPTVAGQRAERDSLWHHLERLIYLRVTEADLGADAGIELVSETGSGAPLVYRRGAGLMVALNPSNATRRQCLPRLGDVTPVLSHRCQLSRGGDGWQLRLGGLAYGLFNVR